MRAALVDRVGSCASLSERDRTLLIKLLMNIDEFFQFTLPARALLRQPLLAALFTGIEVRTVAELLPTLARRRAALERALSVAYRGEYHNEPEFHRTIAFGSKRDRIPADSLEVSVQSRAYAGLAPARTHTPARSPTPRPRTLADMRGQGENPGFVRARTNVGEHYPWPYVGACPDRYQDEGWCIAPLTKHPGVNLCGKCSHIHGRPTWADDEHKRTCLFSALDGDAEDEDAAPDAVAGDAQQPPLPAERESQVWSANDTEWESTDLSVKFDDKGWPVFGDAAEGTHVVVTTQSGFEVVIYCSRDDDTLGSIFSLHGNGLEKHVHFKLAMEYAVFVNAQLSKQRSRKLKAKTLVAFPCHATERALGAFPEPTHASKPKKRVATAAPGTAGGKPMGTGAGVEESNIILSKRRK